MRQFTLWLTQTLLLLITLLVPCSYAKPRVLVIINGSLRGGKVAWTSLKRFVLDYYHADLALLSPPIEDDEQREYLGQYATYHWEVEDYDDWSVVLDSAVTDPLEKGKWKSLCSHGAAFLGSIIPHCNEDDRLSRNSTGGILLALRYIASEKLHSLRLEEKYDWFIYSRSDYVYLCSPPDLNSLRNDTVHIPSGEAYFGYTDRFLISPSSLIYRALNITSDIVNDYKWWINHLQDKKSDKGIRMIEWSLKKYLDKAEVWPALFPHVAFTVRHSKDQTHFSEGVQDKLLHHYNLRVKYPQEKSQAEAHCDPWVIFMQDNEPVMPPEGKLVQGLGRSIYLVANQTLHYMNLKAFVRMGFEFTQVEFVPDGVLGKLPIGAPILE